MVSLTKKEATIVKRTLDEWQSEGILKTEEVSRLKSGITLTGFNWKKLAKFALWLSIATFFVSISAILADRIIQEMFQVIFNAPHATKCFVLSLFAALFYWLGWYWKLHKPQAVYSSEILLFLGVITTAWAIYQFGMAIDTGSGHFSLLILMSYVIYAVLGILFKSRLIWVFSLLSLGGWFGAETGYISGWGTYFLGMNYPTRFVLFGLALTGIAFLMNKEPRVSYFEHPTLAMGLLYLFIALWILSIFGNIDIGWYRQASKFELFYWSLLFGVVALVAILHGIQYENDTTKGFGLTFIFINLYTKFFEYFWDLHGGIFFGLLAISFWIIGTKAEKIWHLEQTLKIKKLDLP